MGLDWTYSHPRDAFDEMRQCMDSIAGITWERLEQQSSVTYPCVNEGDPGDPVVFIDTFPTQTGRATFVPADLISANERPDAEYPMVLITGRQLEHWHTGSMTRRASALDYIEPEPVASVHPLDLEALGVSRRHDADDRVPPRERSRSTRVPMTACHVARCSSRSATTRRRRTS
jgi:formate dehydrogenase major subunit